MMPSVVPMIPATRTAVMPTIIDTRAPKISRDSTSRPSWSVPSRYSKEPRAIQNGGLKRAVSIPTSGLCGARKSAKIATNAIVPRISTGRSGKSPSRKRRSAAKRDGPAGRRATSVKRLMSSPQSDTRIDDRVKDVNHKIHENNHCAAQDHDPLDDREVAERDALIEQPPDTRPGEHGFDDNRDIDHDHQIDAGQRQYRYQRVLEGVLGDDHELRQALEARQLDVFRAQHFKHRRAGQTHVRGREIPPQSESRHDQVQRRPRPR